MLSRVLVCALSAGLLAAQPAPDPAATARKALDLLLAANYSELTTLMTPEARKAFSGQALAKLGTQIQSWGAAGKIGEPSARVAGPNTVVTIPVEFATQGINFLFGINPAGQVSGMFFNPGAVTWQRPPYSKAGAFTERELAVGSGQYKLPATLTVPTGAGPFPALVLVHGSGPNDRDETIGSSKVFKDLAEGLASRGIAVLRYEKRTRLYPGLAGSASFTLEEETVDDAAEAAALARAQKEIDPARVYLLGHAIGGYAAPRIAARDGKLSGIILLAANARHLEDVVLEQSGTAGLTAARIEAIKAQVARVKALEQADTGAPPVMGSPVAYWLDLKGYDAPAEAKKLAVPLLVLQGERDSQVTMTDFALWKAALAARSNTTLKSYPALNHLFVPGEGKSTEAEYRKPGHVAPEVVDDIAAFILKTR
jgi:dienelactone hydrolase